MMESKKVQSSKLPPWILSLVNALKSTRSRLGIRLAARIKVAALRVTHKRVVAVSIAIIGFAIAVRPVVTATTDSINFIGERFFDWGVCHELSPSATGFNASPAKRTCNPGEIAAFKWRYPLDKDGCDQCFNRALVVAKAERSGRTRFVEYYLKKATASPAQEWGPGHNWIVVDPLANRGSGSFSQGLLLRRQDDPAVVKNGRVQILEAFVPLEVGIGCEPAARAANPDGCRLSENTMYFRWVSLEQGESQVPEALYHKSAEAWHARSPISAITRDPD